MGNDPPVDLKVVLTQALPFKWLQDLDSADHAKSKLGSLGARKGAKKGGQRSERENGGECTGCLDQRSQR